MQTLSLAHPHVCYYVNNNKGRCINLALKVIDLQYNSKIQSLYCIRHLCMICRESKHSYEQICSNCTIACLNRYKSCVVVNY